MLEAAEKLHYVPNAAAKRLKSGKTQMLGLYTTSIRGPYFSTLVDAIAREAEKNGYGLNILISADKEKVIQDILGNIVDGIIGFEDILGEQDLEAMKREQICSVFIDRKTSSEKMGSVTFDSRAQAKAAVEYLISLGHTWIGYITGYPGVYDNDERLLGFKEALEEKELLFQKDWVLNGYFEEKQSYQVMKKFLENKKDYQPTAFLAGNDLSAIGIIKAIKAEGYKVPTDFNVIGFDGIELLKYFQPRLTSVYNPIEEQGKRAVKLLLEIINKQTKGKSIVLSGHLVKQETTSPLLID